jgi:hypothetical protein
MYLDRLCYQRFYEVWPVLELFGAMYQHGHVYGLLRFATNLSFCLYNMLRLYLSNFCDGRFYCVSFFKKNVFERYGYYNFSNVINGD